jgi:hypothetical protein
MSVRVGGQYGGRPPLKKPCLRLLTLIEYGGAQRRSIRVEAIREIGNVSNDSVFIGDCCRAVDCTNRDGGGRMVSGTNRRLVAAVQY